MPSHFLSCSISLGFICFLHSTPNYFLHIYTVHTYTVSLYISFSPPRFLSYTQTHKYNTFVGAVMQNSTGLFRQQAQVYPVPRLCSWMGVHASSYTSLYTHTHAPLHQTAYPFIPSSSCLPADRQAHAVCFSASLTHINLLCNLYIHKMWMCK